MVQVSQANSPLDLWLSRVTDLQLPMLDHSILQLRQLSENVNAPPAKLASIILQDPLLTTRVLRMANSVYFNPSRGHIRTVSRAVIVLGFATVRSICLSSLVLEKFSQTVEHPALTEELAWSFVAAFILKVLALKKAYQDVEELYIGALLYRIGPMMFWLSERPECALLTEALQQRQNRSRDLVERQVLGFSLNELGGRVLRGWSLSSLLNELWSRGPQAVEGGPLLVSLHQYLDECRTGLPARREVPSLAGLLKQSPAELEQLLRQGIQHTCSALKDYGAPAVVEYLQQWTARVWPSKSSVDEAAPTEKEPQAGFSPQQQQRQLAAIKDLLTQLSQGPDVNNLMQLLLEGLQQGAGFSRVLVAFLDPARSRLQARFVLAPEMDLLQNQFQFSRSGEGRELLDWLLSSREVCYGRVGGSGFKELPQRLGCREYLLAPLWGSSKAIALLYADNHKLTIAAHQQDAFRLFAMQASMVILWLEQRRGGHPG